MLYKRRNLALQQSGQKTTRCTDSTIKRRGAKCQCCEMVSNRNYIESNNVRVDCEGGNCQTRGVVYGATCTICQKVYVGKGVNELRNRLNGHRSCFYNILSKNDDEINELYINKCDDDQILGLHIYLEHSKCEKKLF